MDKKIIDQYIVDKKHVIDFDKFKEQANLKRDVDKIYLDFIIYQQKNKIIINNDFKSHFDNYKKQKRFDFNENTKKDLEREASSMCSICSKKTFITECSENYNIGQAAHIIAAGPTGPRSDISKRINEEDIKSIKNGIWLCPTCHIKIDRNPNDYTIEGLSKIKSEHLEHLNNFSKYKLLPNKVTDNLTNKNIYTYFNNFKSKKETIKSLTLEELIKEIEIKSENKSLIIKDGHKLIVEDNYLKPTDKILLSDYGVTNQEMKKSQDNSYIYKNIIDVIFSFELVNNKTNESVTLIDYTKIPAYKIEDEDYIYKKLKSVNTRIETTEIDINNTYSIKTNSGHEFWLNKDKKIVFVIFDLLIFNMMKLMHIEFRFSIDGKKEACIFR